MVSPIRRCEEYSEIMTPTVTMTPPMPVISREAIRCSKLPASPEYSIPAATTARLLSAMIRRPIRSPIGARNSEPSAMPAVEALSP